ncbi:MAG TPA: heat-inducible transcriptional repressor HrcA [Clostridia bacterium]|nr:heat-inducible transcriptional repressor HrcA [Clostridia bacterium]
MELSERKQKILAAIIELHIDSGEPVGSKVLVEKLDMSVSSATVRKEMSELSSLGLLEQPHTSSGRIPSHAGYRYYVDNLMNKYELNDSQRKRIDADISFNEGDPEKLLEKAGEVLADITNCAAVSTLPQGESVLIKRIEIVPIGTRTAMIVLLTTGGVIRSRVCRLDYELNNSMMEIFYNVTTARLVGCPVCELSAVMLQTIVASLGVEALAMLPLLATVADLAKDAEDTDIMLEGQSNLLNHREFSGSAQELMEFLRKAEPLNRLIAASKNELDVLIGKENLYRQLEKSSIILARYNVGEKEGGIIGLIGPTRIDYSRLIPSVKYLTNLVGRLLTQALED